MLALIARVAPTDASILITGESGTGKELIAEAVHAHSPRRLGPFVKVNLGGISSTLFESEMFGHVRGAFTDARADRRGRFEMADHGTIVLDEIGELDLAAQVKLLRVLQDRSYEVLGSSATRRVDVRVVSSTNRDLVDMVAKGTVPRGSLLPLEPDRRATAGASRTPERRAAAGRALPRRGGATLRASAARARPRAPSPGFRRVPGRATCAS